MPLALQRQAMNDSLPTLNLPTLLRHGLITAAFCCLIATALTLSNRGAWDTQLVYSLGIGMTIWLIVDVGRFLLRRASDHYWPSGMRGVLLVISAIAVGYLVGTTIGDLYCSACALRDADPGRQRTSLVITLLAGVAGSYFFHSMGKAKAQQAKIALAERDAAEARLKLLQTQLEPHMLFNTLANLRVLIGVDPAQATQMLDRLIAFLRATLVASRETQHPLATEFDRLRDYLELMAVRMGPRLTYALELPSDLAATQIPTLLLQPLVENSIRHGLEPQIKGGSITVSARAVGDQLELEVLDTGAGLGHAMESSPHEPGTSPAGTGFGVLQVRERLATAYGERASLQIANVATGGTRCLIKMPRGALSGTTA
jgi:hypothetical protein